MKKLIFIALVLIPKIIYSQEEYRTYKYYLYVSDYKNVHQFEKQNLEYIYKGKNTDDKAFFSKYTILDFNQAFEDGIDENVKNIFYVEVLDSKFVLDLRNKYPNLYLSSDDITDLEIDLLNYYPNDYGSSSPNVNLGFDFFRKEYDYINVPGAWDITTGDPKIKIGISDTPIKYDDPDFANKITIIDGYTPSLLTNSHGTGVAATAAARGDNAYGSVGVCMDCEIVEGPIGGNSTSNIIYSTLYKMAKKGAKVINMSWTNSGYTNNGTSFIAAEQMVINDLVNNYRVTLVAAAGNRPSFGTPESNIFGAPYGVIYVYPATYDNVISVSSIRHKNSYILPLTSSQSSYCCTSSWFPVYLDLEDSVAHSNSGLDPYNPIGVLRNGYYQNPNNPDGFQGNHTLNDKVDILAPGYDVFWHNNVYNPPTPVTGNGTSCAAPAVSGTIGLMLSINDCLFPKEIESILKLTSKDVESLPINQNYVGYIGSGKLEVEKAVRFTNEMKKTNGNAEITNHVFNRFEFNLERINNNLTIENVTFKDFSIAEFKAKNQIHLKPGTELKPNSTGKIHLSIKEDIDITCSPVVFERNSENKSKEVIRTKSSTVLYPNPNNGYFDLKLATIYTQLKVSIVDINGRTIFSKSFNEIDSDIISVDVSNISNGIYFVNLSNNSYFETIKFIKK